MQTTILNFESNSTGETWKSLYFDRAYYISDQGNICSTDRDVIYKNHKGTLVRRSFVGKQLSPCYTKDGYQYVCIHGLRYLVHRLLFEIFNPNIDIRDLDIDHIDSNRSNNKLENLRAITHKENVNDPARIAKFIASKKGMTYQKHQS